MAEVPKPSQDLPGSRAHRQERIGVLLLNVGTPDSPDAPAVRRYLRQFLSDPRVLDIPAPARFLLLNAVILPFRPARSAQAYAKVWTPEGSPLLVHSKALEKALAARLGPGAAVALGMHYGNPSIPSALASLRDQGVDRLVIAPLYPQYSASATGAGLEAALRELAQLWAIPAVSTLSPFWHRSEFLRPLARSAQEVWDSFHPDYVLFSFHGLPERHMVKADATGTHCLRRDDCCAAMVDANRNCYRAQSHDTARRLAELLHLLPGTHSVSFQSRLGRTPWIRPYTDLVLPELAKRGVRRVMVVCPAFMADCLETLEEIGIRARDDFKRAGGEDLALVPSLNARADWVEGLAGLIRELVPVQSSTALPGR